MDKYMFAEADGVENFLQPYHDKATEISYEQLQGDAENSTDTESRLSRMEELMGPIAPSQTWMNASTVLQCTVALFLTLSIVITNFLVLLVRIRNKVLRKQVSSFFIKSLAVSDLCVGLFQSVPGISSVLFLDNNLGYWWVKLSVYGTMTASAVSMYAIICISIDRYIAITNPLRYYALITTKQCRAVVILCWVCALILMLPVFTPIIPTVYSNSTFACVVDYGHVVPFVVVLGYIIYVPTGLTLLIVYVKIMIISRKHVQQIEKDRRRFSINPDRVRRESVAKRTKYLRNSLFIIATWFVTWVPRGGYIVYEIHVGRLAWADFVTLWLTLSNSFTHAMIYNWFHKEFRLALRNIFFWCPYYGKKEIYKQLVYSVNGNVSVL